VTATRCLVPQENCGRAFWHRIHQRADRPERAVDAGTGRTFPGFWWRLRKAWKRFWISWWGRNKHQS